MPRFSRLFARRAPALLAAALAGAAASLAIVAWGGTPEESFMAENVTAMDRMMSNMDIKSTGDIDQDFVAMMIPHHQGAIDMAQAQLRYGSNDQLRRIAQEIIVEQQQEIIAMRLALDQPLPPSAPAPDQMGAPTATPAHPMPRPGMSMHMEH